MSFKFQQTERNTDNQRNVTGEAVEEDLKLTSSPSSDEFIIAEREKLYGSKTAKVDVNVFEGEPSSCYNHKHQHTINNKPKVQKQCRASSFGEFCKTAGEKINNFIIDTFDVNEFEGKPGSYNQKHNNKPQCKAYSDDKNVTREAVEEDLKLTSSASSDDVIYVETEQLYGLKAAKVDVNDYERVAGSSKQKHQNANSNKLEIEKQSRTYNHSNHDLTSTDILNIPIERLNSSIVPIQVHSSELTTIKQVHVKYLIFTIRSTTIF